MRRTITEKIADIIDERSIVDAAGVRNANEIAKAILVMIQREQQSINHKAKRGRE